MAQALHHPSAGLGNDPHRARGDYQQQHGNDDQGDHSGSHERFSFIP
jgi:hypothetical protein